MAEDETKYSGEYSWVIKGNLLTNMLTAENKKKFQSSPFKMCGLRWCIDLYPNDKANDCVGSFGVYLKLLSLPQNANKIIICRRIHCKESQSSHTDIKSYKKDFSNGWTDYTLSLNEII
eukprot:532180_1